MICSTAACVLIFLAVSSGLDTTPAEKPKTAHSPEQSERTWQGKAALTYYFDSREYETFSVFSSLDGLPLDLHLWGFTDFHGEQDHGSGRFDLARYFLEYRLLLPLEEAWLFGLNGFGALAEYNDFNGPNNDLFRFGAYYQHALPLPRDLKGRLQWRIFPYETDGRGWQSSVSYSIPFARRVSLTGFADLNFGDQGTHRWVIEPQLNLRLSRRFSAVVEFRYNGFEQASSELKGFGVAGGLRFTQLYW